MELTVSRLVSAGGTGGATGKRNCVIATTAAASSKARKYRFSIREPGHIHPPETGDTARFGGLPSSFQLRVHSARALQLHTLNTSDNSDMLQGVTARSKAGSFGSPE